MTLFSNYSDWDSSSSSVDWGGATIIPIFMDKY